ncbi:MAG TPA: GspE/PulE family protein [Candidatus Paceibacterota bacterium]|jgi:type II secretory ATPase GspE/PulE/Tfp pilus assembly ATPase PilB-like protein
MTARFDTKAEDEKLANLRAREEEDLARILADKHDLPYTDLSIIPINMDALRVIPKEDAEAAGALAFDKNGKHLSLAVRTLENDALTKLRNDLAGSGYLIEMYLVSAGSLARGLERYSDLSLSHSSRSGVFDIASDELGRLRQELTSLPALRAHLMEGVSVKNVSKVSKLLEGMLAAAFALQASDVHLEPGEGLIRLRLRLDGVLTDAFSFDEHAYRLINSRIKVLSGLKLNVTDRAQDGRFSVDLGGHEVEIRTSIIPGNYGESIVLRLLDPSSIQHSFTEMGIHPKLLARLETEIRRPNGMLLTTGPTGSGKTTTLYSFLKEIHTPDIKIVTIEDPIEYHLPGIVQTQTNGDDYTFASGLRSVLRQDPDVIMVGEIRDAEVAEVAVQAALTGHFVFSTLHTNNAAGAFPRLVDLGQDPKTFASAITVAMAQRLVRTLDQGTKVRRKTTDEEKRVIEKIFSSLTDESLRPFSIDEVWSAHAEGEASGYKGRTGVHEAIFLDDRLGTFLRDNPSSGDIEKEAARQGYLTMAQDGVLKALSGETSLEEVFKVVDVPRG